LWFSELRFRFISRFAAFRSFVRTALAHLYRSPSHSRRRQIPFVAVEATEQFIPEKYNKASELKLEVKSGSNTQNFALSSK